MFQYTTACVRLVLTCLVVFSTVQHLCKYSTFVSQVPRLSVIQYSADGDLVDGLAILRAAGIDLNSWILRKGTAQRYQVMHVDADVVSISPPGSGSFLLKMAAAEVVASFEPSEAPMERNPLWPSKRVSISETWHIATAKAMVLQALAVAAKSMDHGDLVLDIMSKPTKAVIAGAVYKKGALYIVPEVLNMIAAPPGQPPTHPYATVKFAERSDTFNLTLVPTSAKDASLGGSFRTSDRPEKTNMGWVTMKIASASVPDLPSAEALQISNAYSLD